MRGRSAAAAALSIAKDAPIAVRSLSIVNPLCLNRIFPAAPVRCPLMFVGSGVHHCTFTNALAETIAQQESSDAQQFPRRCGAKVTGTPQHPHIREISDARRDPPADIHAHFATGLCFRALFFVSRFARRCGSRLGLVFSGLREPASCEAATVASACLSAMTARHLEGLTLRRARNCRLSAGLNVASYARRTRASYRHATSARTAKAMGTANGIIAD